MNVDISTFNVSNIDSLDLKVIVVGEKFDEIPDHLKNRTESCDKTGVIYFLLVKNGYYIWSTKSTTTENAYVLGLAWNGGELAPSLFLYNSSRVKRCGKVVLVDRGSFMMESGQEAQKLVENFDWFKDNIITGNK